MSKIIITKSNKETKKVARDLVRQCPKQGLGHALVIGLMGNLGSGKTTFVQGFAKALGIKERIISPTFVILKRFKIQDSRFKNLVHIDAYRIKNSKEIINLKWKELIKNPKNIIIIEWADRIKKILPKKYVRIDFKHKDKNKRWIKIKKF